MHDAVKVLGAAGASAAVGAVYGLTPIAKAAVRDLEERGVVLTSEEKKKATGLTLASIVGLSAIIHNRLGNRELHPCQLVTYAALGTAVVALLDTPHSLFEKRSGLAFAIHRGFDFIQLLTIPATLIFLRRN